MIAPYGLKILENCISCPLKRAYPLCNLPLMAVQRLNAIKSTAVYSKGTVLFLEGQLRRGVSVLCIGKAKFSTSSREGRTVITKLAEAGNDLGWNATISNVPYEVNAEMMESGQANFIPRERLILMMRECPEVAERIAEQLSRNYFAAHDEIRTLGLANSPSERLAKILPQWSSKATQKNGSLRIKFSLTQAEMAEIIGTTRETVARLFAEFKKKHLLQVDGATLVIHNRFALEQMVQS